MGVFLLKGNFYINTLLFILLLIETLIIFSFLYDPLYYHSSLTLALFTLDSEGSLVNFFTGGIYFAISILLLSKKWLSTEKNKNISLFMTFSALLFLFLSVDEMTGMHERIGDYLGHTGFFPAIEDRYGEWIVLYSGIGALILIFSIKPLLFLFKNYRKEFFIGFLGVFLLLFGAVFMEIASYHFPIRTEATSHLYRLEVAIEEGLEMTGTIILLYCVILLKRNFK